MTMFIKLENGQPTGHAITEENLRMLFPDITFPVFFVPEMVAPIGFGMYEFTQVPDPTTIPRYKKVIEIAPIKQDNGIYYQTFDIVPMDDTEIAAADLEKTSRVRSTRNEMLKQSDWAILPDSPLTTENKEEWIKYRQQLRDLPTNPGFPWDITFSTTPK